MSRFHRLAAAVLAALGAAVLGSSPAPAQPPRELSGQPPGQYDFLLLTFSYVPQFCYSQAHKPASQRNDVGVKAECGSDRTFILHGLWPQNDDNSYPAFCAPSQPVPPAELGKALPLMLSKMLVQHEWAKHGTCFAPTARSDPAAAMDSYFTAMQKLRGGIALPDGLPGRSYGLDEVKRIIAAANPGLPVSSLRLSCSGGNWVGDLRLCLDKSLHFRDCGALPDDGCQSGRPVRFTARDAP